ncbi:hypothetical protein DRH29_02715 [candidate division Kazan bacterium]|uniref:Uncharacterized protein n=1 Tax=candidate division Kazan bacterium TaxID=2202143 RepID=A0A420ZCP6_UNCK3|nr:MAG: hypothetical protein DRH29_02715 [candidate division Kazan bacterium]
MWGGFSSTLLDSPRPDHSMSKSTWRPLPLNTILPLLLQHISVIRMPDQTSPNKLEKPKSKSIIPLLSDVELAPIEEMQSVKPVETMNELRKLYNTIKAHFLVLIQDEVATRSVHPDILRFSQELRKLLEMLLVFELKFTQSTKSKASPKTSDLLEFFKGALTDEDRERIASKIHEKIKILDVEKEEADKNGKRDHKN